MKSEYSLNVAIPIDDAVKRLMEMPGARVAEGSTYYSKIKPVLTRNQVCLREMSESQIEFSESFGAFGRTEIIGDCIFKSVSENRTQITAKFQVGTTPIIAWKIAFWLFLFLFPVAVWFLRPVA